MNKRQLFKNKLVKKSFSGDENRSSLKEILMNIFQAKENNPNGGSDVQE